MWFWILWLILVHDDVIKWKHFLRNWPFVRKIHRSPVNFPHKGQWRGALMFSLIYAWINDWANNREAGDLRRQHGHYDVIVMNQRCAYRVTRHHQVEGHRTSFCRHRYHVDVWEWHSKSLREMTYMTSLYLGHFVWYELRLQSSDWYILWKTCSAWFHWNQHSCCRCCFV